MALIVVYRAQRNTIGLCQAGIFQFHRTNRGSHSAIIGGGERKRGTHENHRIWRTKQRYYLHGGGLSWWNFRAEAELLSDRYHVVLPVLDGHADSDSDFDSIEENTARIINYIDSEYGGSVLLVGGLSLGAQVLTEMLTRRNDICRFAVIEGAFVMPSIFTKTLIGPAFSSCYSLIQKKSFAKTQFKYLRIRDDLFEDYYRDTSKITKTNMIAFLKANITYEIKPELQNSRAQVRIVAGEKEQKKIIRSAELLHEILPGSRLEIKDGLYHGEYSINHPQQYVKELLEMIAQ